MNKYMLQMTTRNGSKGMLSPTTLRFDDKAQAEVVAERYRALYPDQPVAVVLVNTLGYVIPEAAQ